MEDIKSLVRDTPLFISLCFLGFPFLLGGLSVWWFTLFALLRESGLGRVG
jgi:hypothetical protein